MSLAETLRPRKEHGHTSILDYDFDWTKFLQANNANDADTISEIACSVEPVGLPISDDGVSGLPGASHFTRTVDGLQRTFVKVWVGQGDVGAEYTLTARVVTTAGREDEDSVTLVLVDR